jgi:hypothetical protein
MSIDDDDRPSVGVTPSRRPNVRRRIAVGAVGAAAILGVGAYAITSHVTGEDSTASRDTAGPSLPAASYWAMSPSASVSGSPALLSPDVRKEIDTARSAAASARQPVTKPLPAPNKVLPDNSVSTQIKDTKDGYLRITTARADLTDQKDQRMAADQGTKIGDVNCTQHFHFAANVKPKVIPNMMICWRLSARRSVVTLGVTHVGKPSPLTYASIIHREWAKLR